MSELYEDMMTSLENAYCQMRTAGLGYATHALEAQMEDFRERMVMDSKGMVEYKRPDGKVDGGKIIELFVASRIEIDEGGGNILIRANGAVDGNEKYVIAIAQVD